MDKTGLGTRGTASSLLAPINREGEGTVEEVSEGKREGREAFSLVIGLATLESCGTSIRQLDSLLLVINVTGSSVRQRQQPANLEYMTE